MNDRGVYFVLGLLLGAALGAAVMFFLAPAEGAKSRQQVIDQGIALRRRAQETADDLGGQISERSQAALALATKPFHKRESFWERLRFW
jgi:gas vesicle protein